MSGRFSNFIYAASLGYLARKHRSVFQTDIGPSLPFSAGVGVNIDLISTSEIRISVLVKDTELDKAVVALHEEFGLGGDEEAVVYAGTGR